MHECDESAMKVQSVIFFYVEHFSDSHFADFIALSPFNSAVSSGVYLYCCPDCLICLANDISMNQTTWAIWAAIKKYICSHGIWTWLQFLANTCMWKQHQVWAVGSLESSAFHDSKQMVVSSYVWRIEWWNEMNSLRLNKYNLQNWLSSNIILTTLYCVDHFIHAWKWSKIPCTSNGL